MNSNSPGRDAWTVDSELLTFLTLPAANPGDKSVRADTKHEKSKVRLWNDERKKNGKQPFLPHISNLNEGTS